MCLGLVLDNGGEEGLEALLRSGGVNHNVGHDGVELLLSVLR